jgi:hypothetical protein
MFNPGALGYLDQIETRAIKLHVISSFEPSAYVELAILTLEKNGFNKESIAAVPMEPTTQRSNLFDSLHRANGIGVFDAAAVLGTIFSVLGASFGFQLRWGPLIWGLIGLAAGVSVGVVLYWLAGKRHNKKTSSTNAIILLIIHCEEGESSKVIPILKEFSAISIGTLD